MDKSNPRTTSTEEIEDIDPHMLYQMKKVGRMVKPFS